jgi:D-aminopeptidase
VNHHGERQLSTREWLPRAIVIAFAYLSAGLLFAALAGNAATHKMVVAWRLAAWIVSAIAFALHIVFEYVRRGYRSLATALHAAVGAALGAFGLAAAATIHSYLSPAAHRFPAGLALVLWPLITGIPAFVAAFIAAAVLARVRRATGPPIVFLLLLAAPIVLSAQARPRARDLGVAPGVFEPGTFNAITDVAGVLVGQVTVIEGDSVRTGITAILPHSGNLFLQRVPAAIQVGNGFGKLLGYTQVRELGELESPILLTCTLCVWKAADAMTEWMLEQPGMDNVRSINPVVGETNDGYELNIAIRSRPITRGQVRAALTTAKSGAVDEGSVGAGTGTRAFEWKGGIGTSSRKLPASLGGYTIGVLVQTNFGGVLQIMGAPVGKELGKHKFANALRKKTDGSIMIVVATDAPLSDRNLNRLASRALLGMARTGGIGGNGSGDYVISFSTAQSVRRTRDAKILTTIEMGNTEDLSALYEGVIEATEEAIYNSLFKATTMSSRTATVEALPIDQVKEILARYGIRLR